MLWTGMALGSLMFISFLGLWFKMPLPIKALTLWSPLLTDFFITFIIILTATGISSSIVGLVASFWCDLLVWVISYFGHPYAEAWVAKQYAARAKLKEEQRVQAQAAKAAKAKKPHRPAHAATTG